MDPRNIRKLREEIGVSDCEVATFLGICPGTQSHYETAQGPPAGSLQATMLDAIRCAAAFAEPGELARAIQHASADHMTSLKRVLDLAACAQFDEHNGFGLRKLRQQSHAMLASLTPREREIVNKRLK